MRGKPADPVGGDHGNLGHGQEVAEDHGTGDQNEHHAGRSQRLFEGFTNFPKGNDPLGIGQYQHRRRPDAAGLGGREPALHEPSDDHEEDDPDPEKLRGRFDSLFPGRSRGRLGNGRVDLDPAVDDEDKEQGNKQSRNDAGEKEFADRLFRDDAEDHQRNARGNQHPQGADGGDDTRGKLLAVAQPGHFGDGDARKGGAGGKGRAAHGLEERGPDHRGHGQTAGDMAHEFLSRIVELLGNIRVGGHLAHEHEKGDDGKPVGGEGVEEIFDHLVGGRRTRCPDKPVRKSR